jgi:hypothetical protein
MTLAQVVVPVEREVDGVLSACLELLHGVLQLLTTCHHTFGAANNTDTQRRDTEEKHIKHKHNNKHIHIKYTHERKASGSKGGMIDARPTSISISVLR